MAKKGWLYGYPGVTAKAPKSPKRKKTSWFKKGKAFHLKPIDKKKATKGFGQEKKAFKKSGRKILRKLI